MSYGTVLIVIEVTGRVYLHSRGTNLKDCCRLDREACCELPWPALLSGSTPVSVGNARICGRRSTPAAWEGRTAAFARG